MGNVIIPYNPKLKEIARKLRNNGTLGEILLWKRLRNEQMLGCDFHRQKPIDEFVSDFYCPKLMLAIEIDGGSHEADEAFINDKKRQKQIEGLGVKFLRFKEKEVREDIRHVLDVIEDWNKNYKQ